MPREFICSDKHLRDMQPPGSIPSSTLDLVWPHVLLMHSSMWNQRSSPARPLDFTSARQALSFGLLADHFAFMSFSFCIVSLILPGGLASVVAAGVAGAVAVCAEAEWSAPATSSMAATQTKLRTIEIPQMFFFMVRRARRAPRQSQCAQKILSALSSVFQTPQASGMPTKAQNSAALPSSPPLPMPNEPCWIDASLLALAAWSPATSFSLIFHFGSTGLIR